MSWACCIVELLDLRRRVGGIALYPGGLVLYRSGRTLLISCDSDPIVIVDRSIRRVLHHVQFIYAFALVGNELLLSPLSDTYIMCACTMP